MNYATIKYYDISNGPGVRVSLYVSGCRNRCKNCFNPETWDFAYGKPFTAEVEDSILKAMEPDYIKGFSLLGGDPFEPENQLALVGFMERLRARFPHKTVWAYTGYDFTADLLAGKKGDSAVTMRLLKCLDVLVDGRFVEELKNPELLFRGSANQRLILVQQSLAMGEVVQLVAETPALYVRKIVPSDVEKVLEISQSAPAFKDCLTAEDVRRLAAADGKDGTVFAAERKSDGVVVAAAFLLPRADRQFAMGVAAGSQFRGQGFGYEAASALLRYAFTELSAAMVLTAVRGNDDAAIKFVKSLDMKLDGVQKLPQEAGGHALYTYFKTK